MSADESAKGSRTSDYEFEIPSGLIAQQPLDRRDASRLMIVDRAANTISHRRFADIADLFQPGDVLVLNVTRVLRARLLGTRDSGSPAEILLLRPRGDGNWEAMVHPGGKLKPGRMVHIAPGFDVEILETTERRTRIVRPIADVALDEALERHGHVPLPPYIHRPDAPPDAERYQTVYARERGSAAAPTAGLHFTPDLLERLQARGVTRADVLLHVGAGTFKPVESDDPSAHFMHEEWYRIHHDAAAAINAARDDGARVWAVGTTAVRALESSVDELGLLRPSEGDTRLFIRPGYHFRVVDKLITNFHLPRSTLVMLVAAFAGYELTMRAYREAIDAQYRFFSYGDAMVVL